MALGVPPGIEDDDDQRAAAREGGNGSGDGGGAAALAATPHRNRDPRGVWKEPKVIVPDWASMEGNVAVLYDLAAVWGSRVALLETVVREQARMADEQRNAQLSRETMFYKELTSRIVDDPLSLMRDLQRIQSTFGRSVFESMVRLDDAGEAGAGAEAEAKAGDAPVPKVSVTLDFGDGAGGVDGGDARRQEEKQHEEKSEQLVVAQRTEAMLRVAMMTVVAQKWRTLYGRLLMGAAWTGLSDLLGMADAAGFGSSE